MDPFIFALQQTQTAVMIAGLVLLSLAEHAHPLFDFFGRQPGDRGRHALRNLVLGALNGAVVSFGFVWLWFITTTWADIQRFGVMNVLQDVLGLPAWVHALGVMVLLDAWMYTWHRINHVIPFLWRFHRVHHADPFMDVTTASRFHLGEIVLSSLLRIPVLALAGAHLWELLVYETIMFAVVQTQHANIVFPERLDRLLRTVIATPAMHKVHHSRWRPETDSNYGSLFSFWDRIGRSFRIRENLSTLKMGLDEMVDDRYQTVRGMIETPFQLVPRSEGEPS
jgi:sterol desaturase/sphingolipid hydroxylase (fatty acid hydroxylase superfamily)